MKNPKATLILLAKLAVSAGLLGYFLSRIDFSQFWETLRAVKLAYVGLALFAYLVGQVISAVRWTVLSRPLGFAMGLSGMTAYYFIGMFFNLFAPGTVAGDLSRIYYLTREGQKDNAESWGAAMLRATVSVIADRAVGMCVLVWLGTAGLLLFSHYAIPATVRSSTYALALGLAMGGACLPLVTRFLPNESHPVVGKLRVALESYGRELGAIPIAMALSLVVHLIQTWMHVVMGMALNLDLPFSFCLILYPLVGVFAAIPISFGGIGLRESGYMFLLGTLGFASEKGIAFGLLLFIVVALDSLLGGLLFLLKGKEASPALAAAGENQFK
ncbi:MAG: flippase-like domain-containing protein [Deltaproteobacteria bacterium]|nr:flippase-like domain-containing protein [Deltaproteobacteria bacterium]